MSVYANNEYIISSNNSMNDNKYNSQKAAKSHRIKSILKPLMKMLRRNSSEKKTKFYPESNTYEDEYCTECEDNSANEELESNIIEEINHCKPNSAIFVCDEGRWDVTPVSKKKLSCLFTSPGRQQEHSSGLPFLHQPIPMSSLPAIATPSAKMPLNKSPLSILKIDGSRRKSSQHPTDSELPICDNN